MRENKSSGAFEFKSFKNFSFTEKSIGTVTSSRLNIKSIIESSVCSKNDNFEESDLEKSREKVHNAIKINKTKNYLALENCGLGLMRNLKNESSNLNLQSSRDTIDNNNNNNKQPHKVSKVVCLGAKNSNNKNSESDDIFEPAYHKLTTNNNNSSTRYIK